MKIIFQKLDQILQKTSPRTFFIIFALVVFLIVIGFTQYSIEDDTSPCSPAQFLGQCYDIPRALCETTLSLIKSTCEIQVKTLTKPGQLTGPVVRNCEQTRFDRILKYTRKTSPSCAEQIYYLESWQKTNPDF